MKRKHSLRWLVVLQVTTIALFVYAYYTYFSIAFDAGDGGWVFSRYFFMMYGHEILFMVVSWVGLVISIFLKNVLVQSKGRFIMMMVNYTFKSIIALSLINAMSSMNTVLYINSFDALLSVGELNILVAFVLVGLVFEWRAVKRLKLG